MRTADPALALAALLIASPPLGAEGPAAGNRQRVTAPQAIPGAGAGGTTLRLSPLPDAGRLERQLRQLLKAGPAQLRLTVAGGQGRLGDFSVGPGEAVTGDLLVLRGNLDVFGKVTGNVVALDGDIVMHQGALVTGDALAIGGRVRDRGGAIRGEQQALGAASPAPAFRGGGVAGVLASVAGLAGVVFTLGIIGFGLVLFARPNLELISDTVTHSVFRSFATGLLAQVVILPTFGILITGLVLSVVGILLVPFVALVVPLLLVAAVVSGFLAVAHAIGEVHTRRRLAAGVRVGSANSYRYVTIGLLAIGAVWLAWAGFGWVPVAGTVMLISAFLATWIVATVGLGACLLSRAGIKPAFAGRYVPPEAMTDEYLWATPQFGVSAVKRPEGGRIARGRE